jgi:threonylcarbamoyladenosine tRNA methylthiotransferase MtaB
LQELVREIPHVRFRLSSLEATEVDHTIRRLYDNPRQLVPYLHAPLQSGSDRILKRMGRHWYTAREYETAIHDIVAGRPVFGLSADVIAGFPGETEADHQATLALIDRLPFTALHVFPFSLRPGTPAERLPDPVASSDITRRARELREAAHRKAVQYEATRVGGDADVIAQGSGAERHGLTEDHLTVAVSADIPRGTRFRASIERRPDGRLAAVRHAGAGHPAPSTSGRAGD